MNTTLSHFHQIFFEEAGEHLATMESLLLKLDVDAPDDDDLNAIFRAAHSIKGGAGTFGFRDLTEVTHVLESLLDRIRNRKLALRVEMVDVFLNAGDVLGAQLAGHRDAAEVDPDAATAVIDRLRELADGPSAAPRGEACGSATAAPNTVRIAYTPQQPVAEHAVALLAELSRLGDASMVSEEGANGTLCYHYTLTSAADTAAIRDIFAFVAQADEVSFDPDQCAPATASTAPQASDDAGFGFFDNAPGCPAEPDPGYGFFTAPPSVEAPDPGYGFFEPIAEPAIPSPSLSPVTSPVPAPSKAPAKAADKSAADTSIRVSVEKVDQMINLVGELVITQAMLAQTVADLAPELAERLLDGMAQLERNTRDLQETVMSIRMLPMSSVFSRFPRVVRDLAGKLNKDVVLVTEGESTELDKGLIEKIVDPLTHLVRNSLDHGIEMAERRLAAGKAARGTITLRAAHQGGNIVIEVEDDGAGLNRDKLLAKARERGLALPDSMTDQDVWMLIFAPGFSTAEVVTDVSGRGVGMDVVKRNIDALNGRVEIMSAAGIGTKVTIRLPLTLAILDGMSIGVGEEVFIIPLTYIAESLQPGAADIRRISGQGRVVHVRGEYLPLVALHELFGLTPHTLDPTRGILVIVETTSGRVALFVDRLLGQHQVVIKSMETNYRKVSGFAGATIMGDGRVAMILDIAAFAQRA